MDFVKVIYSYVSQHSLYNFQILGQFLAKIHEILLGLHTVFTNLKQPPITKTDANEYMQGNQFILFLTIEQCFSIFLSHISKSLFSPNGIPITCFFATHIIYICLCTEYEIVFYT